MSKPTHEELEVLTKKLSSTKPGIVQNPDGSIRWEKLPTKWFVIGLSAILLFVGSIFFLVLGGYDIWGEYNGVAIQSEKNMCRPYQYHALIRNTKKPLPVADGWKVYASIRGQNDFGQESVIIQAPYGEGSCIDDTFQVCCQDRLRLKFDATFMGN